MKRIILAISLFFIGTEAFADSATLINQAKKAVRSQLKDPSSAQFDYVYAVTTISGAKAVCGEVNAKNTYGGYTGFTPFYSYQGYTKIIPNTDNEVLAQLYATNYAEAGCAGKAAEKAVYEQKKKAEDRRAAVEKAKKEREEKEKADAKKEEAELKALMPYAVCLTSYDYFNNRVVKKKKHVDAIKEVRNMYDNYYITYGKGESFESIEKNLLETANAILNDKNVIKKFKNADKESVKRFVDGCVKSY